MEAKYFLVLFLFLFLFGLAFSIPLTECQEITEAGTYFLQNDISDFTDTCFNVTVNQCFQPYDCNDYTSSGEETCNAQDACNWNVSVCENTGDCIYSSRLSCEAGTGFCVFDPSAPIVIDGNNHSLIGQVQDVGGGFAL